MLERLSIEVTNQCAKACWFCYAQSQPDGATSWTVDELVAFVGDCADHGVRAVSFGGGEPLEYPGLFEVLGRLAGRIFRSFTTNGLLLDARMMERVAEVRPDKVHVSVHFPSDVDRVIEQVRTLSQRGVASGINLLVAKSQLESMGRVAQQIRDAGIANDRVVYLPMRIRDTPAPGEVARVAGRERFQSMTCLSACASSPRFCAVAWDKTVAWCSYTKTRRPLASPTYAALAGALRGLGLEHCGGDGDGLVRLGRAGPTKQKEAITYPAAHSMDTEWFAVDADGHVALLDSDEAGAVPRVAGPGSVDAVDAFYETFNPSGEVRDLDHWRAHSAAPHLDIPADGYVREAIVFLASLEDAKGLFARGDAFPLEATRGVCLEVNLLHADEVAELHRRGICLGCFEAFPSNDGLSPAAYGLYTYVNNGGNAISEPYERTTCPDRPLHVDALPPQVRARAARYPGRFASTPVLQPAEWWDCESTQERWSAAEGGAVREFPGEKE